MKKVLSLVLVLALVLGSFSMAFAAETTDTNLSDINGNANEGAIVVANDLGIIDGYPDGTFKPDNAVTRAEFAKMMTRALDIPESALAGFKTSAFKDVDSSHWAVAFLGYCNSKGIMTGYEDGTARPNQTITVNEAMTMVCRALGYTNQAKELVGSWPANYIALGKTLGLYEDVAAVATADRASAAQIIYNALDKDLVYIDADGTTQRQVVTQGPPAVYNSMLLSLGGNDDGKYVLTDTAANKAVINATKYVGSYVKTWSNDDGEIIAIEELSTTLTGDFDSAKGEFEVGDTVYYLEYKNANYDINGTATSPRLFENGSFTGPISGANATSFTAIAVTGSKATFDAAMEEDTRTIAVKLSGKTITEVYSVNIWSAAKMDQFESGDLDTAKAKIDVDGTKFNFKKDKNGEIDMTAFTLVGVSSLDKIAEDNVIEVYWDGTYITKLAVGTKTVKGECSEVNKKKTKYTIDGTKYGLSEITGDIPNVGDTGTAYLTAGGDIAYWVEDNSVADNYAVFYGWDTDSTLKSTTTLAGLCLKDGTDKSFSMKSDTDLVSTGSITTTGKTGNNAGAAGLDKYCLVNYSLDSNNKLAALKEIPIIGTAVTSNDKNKQGAVVGTLNEGRTRIDKVKFAKNVVIFFEDGMDFEIGSLSQLTTDDNAFTLTNNWVALNKDGEIAALVMNKDTAIGSESSFGIINSLSLKVKDGTKTWYVKGLMDGKAFEGFTKLTGDTTDYTVSNVGSGLGGLYQLTVDTDGTVSKIVTGPATIVSDSSIGVVKSVDKTNREITATNGDVFGLSKEVVVYFYDADEEEYVVKSVNDIGKDKNFCAVMTGKKAKDDGEYNVVIYWE